MDTGQGSEVLESNILYILTSKFDNKYGPTIVSQYPKHIAGFAQKGAQKTIQLASLMIPNNIEHRAAAGADCNTFKLYFNKIDSSYQLLPPINEQIEENSKEPSQISFINLVRAQSDKNDSRGSKIRSIALGTTLSNVEIMKPFLLMALEDMMLNDDDDNDKLVKNCFGTLNSIDLSAVRAILEDQPLQQMLQAVVNKNSLNNALDDNTESATRVRKMLKLTPIDRYGNRMLLDKGRIRIHFDQYAADSQFNHLTKDPLSIDLIACLPMHAKTCGHPLLSFLQRLVPLLENIPSTNYSFKIIINSDKSSKEQLCQFVIALSSLFGCFPHVSSSRSPCAISLPYIEVSMINTIKQYFEKHCKSLTFCVMGTANPIFKHHTELWDFYYNLDDETMLLSNDRSDNQRNSLWDPQLLKKFLHMNINEMAPFQNQDHIRIGLLAKFLGIIKEENPNSSEALSALKKVNVIQLMHLNNILNFGHGRDFNLLNSYLIGYKDFVIFDEFFRPASLQYMRWFTTLDSIIDCLFRSDQNLSERQQDLGSLHDILTDILQNIGTSTSNLEAFLASGFNYPFLRSFVGGNLLRKDFAGINVQKEIHENWKKGKSWLHIVDQESIGDGVIKYFVRDRSLNLLSLSLLLNSNIRRPKNSKTKSLDRNSGTSALPVSTATASLNSDYEGRRPRSMSLKWMLNLANPRSRDSILDTVSLRSGSDASVYSFPSATSYPMTNGSGSSSSMSSASSSITSSSSKVSFKFLRGETEKIKKLAFEILSKIEEHPIGEILIKSSLNPFLQLVYEGSKVEFAKNLKDTTRT